MNEILVYGSIGGDVTSRDVATQLQNMRGPIRVRINSHGGSVVEALGIFNSLLAYQGRVTVVIEGAALSAGSLIAMAGDSVEMAANALFMIHAAAVNTRGNAADHNDSVRMLQKTDGVLAETFAAKTGMTLATIKQMMADETWMTASEAKSLGFVDAIVGALVTA
jgi:ATP-dependent protease ClpP protease subunit